MTDTAPRVWAYKPTWYWHGWGTLLPVWRGHDEHARWTLVIGWPLTGRIIIALNGCGDPECEREARRMADA